VDAKVIGKFIVFLGGWAVETTSLIASKSRVPIKGES